MSYFQSIILGIVQGLAEFLPISSSGHLAVIQHFMGIDPENVLSFTVMLHFGTLVAIFAVYWKDIVDLFKELFATIKDLVTGQGLQLKKNETRWLGVMIVVATIPTGLMGIFFEDFFEGLYSNMAAIGIGLIVTGTCMFASERWGGGRVGAMGMNVRNAIFIGICQGIAICPGISRSGSTMVGGLTCRFNREHAVRYAFLISIPTVLGAFLKELPSVIGDVTAGADSSISVGILIAGIVAAAVSGYFAIRVMIKAVTNKKLIYFSVYTWVAGAALIVYSFVG